MPIVKLPRKRLISIDKNSITIDFPKEKNKLSKSDIDKLKNAKGLLKKKNINPVKLQREFRDEWN